jgi:hypothetical protein
MDLIETSVGVTAAKMARPGHSMRVPPLGVIRAGLPEAPRTCASIPAQEVDDV